MTTTTKPPPIVHRKPELEAAGLTRGGSVPDFFASIPCGNPRGPMLLHGMREEVQRELSAAVKACDEVPGYYLDQERAKAAFHGLAEDGDDSWTRDELRECFDMAAGFAKHFDRIMDHVNTLSWAYWRLHRAERRAYGKEGA
jgi:hypothetical protein